MSFFSTIFNAFVNQSECSDDKVLEVQSNDYSRIPIIFRHDCLVLHGPKNDKFELLLLKPLTQARSTTDFSLFRARNETEAMERVNAIRETVISLVEIGGSKIVNRTDLQTICDMLKCYPAYSAGHVIVSMEYTWAFKHPKFASFVNLPDMLSGRTPVHVAIQKKNTFMVECLINLGASLKEKDYEGNFVYHFAAVTTPKLIEMLSKHDKWSLNFQNNEGKSALHVACENDQPDCVKELLRQGADVNMAATIDSAFPIHTAVNVGSATCVKEIIRMHPNTLSMKDIKDGGTPLHWCTSKIMIESLLDQGCVIDAKNFKRASALHKMVVNDRFECVVSLLSHGADPDVQDVNGNVPLHFASSELVLQALLVFKANLNLRNKQGETIRHCIASSNYKQRNVMLFYLNILEAKRCELRSSSCNTGCAPNGTFDGVPPDVQVFCRERTSYDELLDANLIPEISTSPELGKKMNKKGRVLCLDGGGIKGLVLIQLLSYIEEVSDTKIKHLFDWIAGTSTGAILAIAIAMGFDMLACKQLYFKMKDHIFTGSRPYDDNTLCTMLKEIFGENTVMTDITGPKLIIPAILANKDPADLHLFRNYASGEQVFIGHSALTNQTNIECPEPAATQLVWKAARASSAAPTYFEPFEDFVDGGIISNNPTLDTLTEITEYNTIRKTLYTDEECHPASMILSLGVGKPPLLKTNCLSNMQKVSYLKHINMALSMPDILKLLIDQATMSDHHAVDRARAWCGQCGITYLRLSPQLSQAVELDEVRDDVIIKMLWQTMVYVQENKPKIERFIKKLKLV